MSRKGNSDSIFFFAFFFMVVIVGTGLFLGVNSFFGKDYDFRETEARLLASQVKECFYRVPFFNDSFNFYDTCSIVEGSSQWSYVSINSSSEQGDFFETGTIDYRNQCFFEGAFSNPNYPVCVRETLTKGGKTYTLIVGTNQRSRFTLG